MLRAGFRAKYDETAINMHELDASNFDIDQFRSKTKSNGLFSTKQFVVLHHPWKLNKDAQEQLVEELDTVGADTILCIVAENPPRKDNKLFKRLLQADTVEEYAELDAQELRTFIRKEAATADVTIEDDAVEELAAALGNDLWRQHNEIRKLAAYANPITTQVVKEFIESPIDDNIFHLTDALGNRNARLATELLDQQFAAGANEHYLLSMLANHIGTLLKVKKTDGVGLQMHPYVKEKSLKQSKSFTAEQLDALYWKLLTIDKQTKTSGVDARTLLDLFIVEACAA